MDSKLKLTKYFADLEGLNTDTPEKLHFFYKLWWQNIRHNEHRSFGLTDIGFNVISKHLKFYKIDIQPANFTLTNQLIVWLDKFINCPFYITHHDFAPIDSIYVSNSSLAVQLVLFGGDLYKFGKAKSNSAKLETQST